MTQRSCPHRSQYRVLIDGAKTFDRHQEPRVRRRSVAGFLLIVLLSMFSPSFAMGEGKVSPILLADILSQQADQLALIDSDEAARTLFTTKVGPALGLKDAAGVVGANRLSSKLVKELGVADLSQSVYELMAALATWQFADSISNVDARSAISISLPTAARQDWMKSHSRIGHLPDLFRRVQDIQTAGISQAAAEPQNSELLLSANRTAFEASQKATAAWWEIYGWKERVRQAKGQGRLCGTWQWIIHNHQMHGEQKSTVVFPPPGQVSTYAATPSEIIVVGDAIYLRWEQNGRIQEDSLLFIKDNAKIEGSFVNNTGGWGPVSGKRTAPCQP